MSNMSTFNFSAITRAERIVTVSAKAKTKSEAIRKIKGRQPGLRSFLLESVN